MVKAPEAVLDRDIEGSPVLLDMLALEFGHSGGLRRAALELGDSRNPIKARVEDIHTVPM